MNLDEDADSLLVASIDLDEINEIASSLGGDEAGFNF